MVTGMYDGEQGRVRENSGDPLGVPSGLDGSVPDGYYVPPCTFETVDRSVMSLFDATIGFSVPAKGGVEKKVPVIFATGERFALLNRNKPIRDNNGALILPLISIRRTAIEQTDTDMAGRGINQHTGDVIISRRLDSSDRDYQRYLNRLSIDNQDGLANSGDDTATYDPLPMIPASEELLKGGWLSADTNRHVYEIFTIPSPQYYTAVYEVVFWSSYTVHMNQMIERLMSAQLPQGRAFRLDSPEGYWFVAYVDETKASNDNFSDFTDTERIVKYTFSLRVPAYLIQPDSPGAGAPVRRYVSAPDVKFSYEELIPGVDSIDPAIASDPDTAYSLGDSVTTRAAAQSAERNLISYRGVRRLVKDPFSGGTTTAFVRVLDENSRNGETVYSGKEPIKL